MRPRYIALALFVLLYLGWQGVRSGLNTDFQSYDNTLSIADARAHHLYLGSYTVSCQAGIPPPGETHAVRPYRKMTGPLMLGIQTVIPDAVLAYVPAGDVMRRTSLEQWRAARNEAFYLTFEDGAGIHFAPDGQTTPIEDAGNKEYGPNTTGCCESSRSRVPERFWLTARDGERLCEFRFDESTRTEAPPRTTWAPW